MQDYYRRKGSAGRNSGWTDPKKITENSSNIQRGELGGYIPSTEAFITR